MQGATRGEGKKRETRQLQDRPPSARGHVVKGASMGARPGSEKRVCGWCVARA
jgi:hypothetical protein